jgi:hypothetical protein
MEPQAQQDNTLNFDEAKAAIERGFAPIIGSLSINNALLEKQAQRQAVLIEKLYAEIDGLRVELSRRPPRPLSPEAQALAVGAKNVIDGNEKAAPIEAA